MTSANSFALSASQSYTYTVFFLHSAIADTTVYRTYSKVFRYGRVRIEILKVEMICHA